MHFCASQIDHVDERADDCYVITPSPYSSPVKGESAGFPGCIGE